VTRETVLSNARIALGEETLHGSVVLRGGVITDISPGPSAVGEDLDGDHLLPGLVELHTDHVEYHFTPRPGVRWDPLPAVLASDAQLAAAGATTVLDAVRIGSEPGNREDAGASARDLADSIELAADAGLLRADHAIHVRCEVSTEDCLDSFGEFVDDPHVRLVSVMDHTPGQRQFADIEAYKRNYLAKLRLSESEFEAFVAPRRERSARYADPHRRAIAKLAAERGLTLATHDDATPDHVAESVELARGSPSSRPPCCPPPWPRSAASRSSWARPTSCAAAASRAT
jgi:alpha-D-ribose 1-methylphosphonate 5-triphosphate diphosphatase